VSDDLVKVGGRGHADAAKCRARQSSSCAETRSSENRGGCEGLGYRFGSYRSFIVADTKRRLIMAAPVRDRVVHHAIVNVLDLLARKIKDRRVLSLTASLLAATPVDPVFGAGKGIPIGNLTSQLFANYYLAPLDRHAKEVLRLDRYVRYVDDLIALDGDKTRLHDALASLSTFAGDALRLSFHPQKSRVLPVRCGVEFVGYVVEPGRVRVRSASIRRFAGCGAPRRELEQWNERGRVRAS
jgi:hypothetical protein